MAMNEEQRATEFAVFCIENTAAQLGCDGIEIFQALQQSNGIKDFLFPSYPTLHTQSKEYAVEEVTQYLERYNPAFMDKLKRRMKI